ncbi:MAG: IS91 family transposase [Pseudophaeobacter sp. bin_em_oilr2.035]|uniref:IS91 family transposase n=1 Tax=Phaeobacter gallaeciensis TaxID=60890 RepID=A0ABD4XCY9_9RHOB|nr:IS91 family transposase [Phaeobacter gallaeciensis]MDF1772025.1 IS91 family transposase [Pseudophaeobacter sp. bin_em_oilr2.035]MDE4146307.1 IS91 family transposase [Phaeobacter gallaeciensis]MDE4158980.1 IS91 family transposase [Phaeobacter gallaeciensis]MDE4163274.1 IS91 family transposase [Phaeobacter gallaeciensis]MDE4167387.1 IS91 family transposase [Phaeobacter gallaeciensis]
MSRAKLEIADIFRAHGPAWRRDNAGHVSLVQLKVMSAIEACRTEALGGHVAGCTKCGHHHIAYNSCKNRHCPKCQGPAARDWMEARAEDLLPVEYFHVVFTLPAEIARIAYWNKRAVYGLLFKSSAQTVMTIAADPKRLGARVGMTSVLHTWGSALTHHPHVHMIVPGGGLSPGGSRWIACRPGFFLHVRVLARLFRRLFLEGLMDLHRAGKLAFFGDLEELAEAGAFAAWLAPFRKSEWAVYAKPPFGGPEAVLAYLSRYTHRVAISNARLVSADANTVAFRWKDYRIKRGDRQKVMRLATPEFIRRFLIHVLPDGFHRIRHYGLLASSTRKANITKIRALLCLQRPEDPAAPSAEAEATPLTLREPCPCCGGPMRIIEIFRRGQKPMSRAPPREQAA